jgi:hypothetical protein
MPLPPDIAGFSRLMTALDPWLDRVVIVGGWAHRLHHLHSACEPEISESLAAISTTTQFILFHWQGTESALHAHINNIDPHLRFEVEVI